MLDEGAAGDGDGEAAADGSKQEAGDSKLEQFAIPSQLQQRHLEVHSWLLTLRLPEGGLEHHHHSHIDCGQEFTCMSEVGHHSF